MLIFWSFEMNLLIKIVLILEAIIYFSLIIVQVR
jgi:hypothetical protein